MTLHYQAAFVGANEEKWEFTMMISSYNVRWVKTCGVWLWIVGGLLHGVPDDDEMPQRNEQVLEALRECVHESRAGGRLDAVEQLSLMLSLYTGLRLEWTFDQWSYRLQPHAVDRRKMAQVQESMQRTKYCVHKRTDRQPEKIMPPSAMVDGGKIRLA